MKLKAYRFNMDYNMNWLKKLFTRTPKPKEYIDYDVGRLECSVEFDSNQVYTWTFEGDIITDYWFGGGGLGHLFYKNDTAFNKFSRWKNNLPAFLMTEDDTYLPSSSIKQIKIIKQESKIETVEVLK